ncbi:MULTISPECIES: hypothetical protein [Pseudomonas syringae group]|uniref:Uncharacterized protein n=1 Tax=Pseudomonas lijiangensis TaxID=2995658 RepID=A0ABX8HRY1_9PSED|nr:MULTISPECIES: hypothetical protein [Pseudomonas syringae group]MBX8501762.1 hypothetical protein [Pseudomonas lijiangensis]MBX8506597.1 hypothetical protein [Pseudomonas lijiangensis]MBX8522654.1 hypothetical protein [Pseudomonas cichorii]MBX8547260.1 hypothetical protein [Pseudomonas cichorii]MBX8552489.1 hypothetical protein [Pseudomonas cichorii]
MKFSKLLLSSLALATMTVAATAQAGPPVTVTFKNLGTAAAEYKVVSTNERSTQLNAKETIDAVVAAGGSDTYVVQTALPDSGYASVRYAIGTKVCVFSTTFINAISTGGVKVPKWTRTATPSGGAVCTATSSVTNLSTYAWSAEFTMK